MPRNTPPPEIDPYDYDETDEMETTDSGSDYTPPEPPPRLMLPVLPDRDPRKIGVEQEIGGGADIAYVATVLNQAGFAPADYQGYGSSGSSRVVNEFMHVENDSSVDAELVYHAMRLDSYETARKFERALLVVREMIGNGDAALDMRCGLHVHVDGTGLGMAHVENLYHLWNHLEDTIYRLAAANWRCHRTSIAEYNYAPTTTKGLRHRLEIGEHFDGTRGGLNLSNYLASRGSCTCGAFRFASWEDCTCNLHKSTVEFRVFNGTANLRKVHAYTALSLAMVEASRRLTINPEDFEPHPFERRFTASTNSEHTKRALDFIFSTLPLTESEKEDLAYCAENSSIAEEYRAVVSA